MLLQIRLGGKLLRALLTHEIQLFEVNSLDVMLDRRLGGVVFAAIFAARRTTRLGLSAGTGAGVTLQLLRRGED